MCAVVGNLFFGNVRIVLALHSCYARDAFLAKLTFYFVLFKQTNITKTQRLLPVPFIINQMHLEIPINRIQDVYPDILKEML